MDQPKTGEPWAYVAHKDGLFAGVAAGNLPRKDLQSFLGDFAADGFAITTVFNRDEYRALLATLGTWRSKEAART